MDSETERPNPNITWEVVEPGRLLRILDSTVEETVLQDVAAANIASERLPMVPAEDIERRDGFIKLIQQTTARAAERIRTIQDLLRQDPNRPIPIDHRYENTTGHLIIALDAVSNPPTLEHKNPL